MRYSVYYVGGKAPSRYVAEVEASGLDGSGSESLWYKMNSVVAGWWENEGVNPSKEVKAAGGERSMMVGDLAYAVEEDKWYKVAPMGWEEVELSDKISYSLYNYDAMGSIISEKPAVEVSIYELLYC